MDESKSTLQSLLTVHLREQIGSVMAAAQLLSPAVQAAGEAKYGHYLSILNQSTYRLLRLTEQAEFLAQGEEGLPFHPAPVELGRLCGDLSRQVSGLAALLQTEFLWEAPGQPLWVEGDALLLERMLLNLIANALEAAGKGGRAGLRLARSGQRVCLTVWDNGPGDRFPSAPEEERPSLQPGGLGLGVSLARAIALRHGGTLLFERGEEDRGLRAAVSLPLVPAGTRLCSPELGLDPSGGLSQVMVELSGLLPWEAYSAEDLE